MSIHDQNIIIRSLFSLFCGNSRALSVVQLRWRCSILYNYPTKGRWIVMVYWDAKRRGIYPALFTDPEGDSCFSIYRISWIKMKPEVTFCCVINLLPIEHKNNFLPTSKHWQAKVRRFLGICLYDCFIYRWKSSLSKMSRDETPSWLRLQNTE